MGFPGSENGLAKCAVDFATRNATILILYEQTCLPDVRDDRRSGVPRQMGMRHLRPRMAARSCAGSCLPGLRIVKDAHGNVLADGDCVILIKDLKLGGSQVLKGGSKSKPIRLVDGDHEIDCKVDGIAVGLKACFVKKV